MKSDSAQRQIRLQCPNQLISTAGWFVLAVACFLSTGSPTCATNEKSRPNILFIMSDDHACNAISAYGGRLAKVAPTPNIDRIGREGMRLDECFVTNSICTPSRAVILSGQHSHINTVRTLNDAFPGPDSGTPNVADMLRRSGYETALIGKWHLRSAPWGFDYWKVGPGQGQYHDPFFVASTDGVPYSSRPARNAKRTEGYYTDLVTDYAVGWLDNRDDEKPFFLMLHHKAPHGKWEPADRHKEYLADVEIPEPATLWEDFSHRSEATREMGTSITSRLAPRRTMVNDVQKKDWPAGSVDMSGMTEREKGKAAYQKYLHDYLGCVKAVDENVGRVLDYLDETGLAGWPSQNGWVAERQDASSSVCYLNCRRPFPRSQRARSCCACGPQPQVVGPPRGSLLSGGRVAQPEWLGRGATGCLIVGVLFELPSTVSTIAEGAVMLCLRPPTTSSRATQSSLLSEVERRGPTRVVCRRRTWRSG